MKKVINVLVIIALLISVNSVYAGVEINNENRFGQEISCNVSSGYSGDMVLEGVYVAQTTSEYIFTIVYSNGELNRIFNVENSKIKTSFFNPPNGDIISINWINNYDKLTEGNGYLEYHVEKELLEKVDMITVFLPDANMDDQDIILTFRMSNIDFDNIPDYELLVSGYEITQQEVASELKSNPASWAARNIEELKLENTFREEAFTNFSEGITRERFVYLMVKLYEALTDSIITVDTSITFEDSNDTYVLKAATIGITSGIGDNKFGPEIILNREQMTTFLIKTLKLANVDIKVDAEAQIFSDKDEISGWAQDSVNIARLNGIMGGTGNNMFAPKANATNEQALYITHDLLSKYGSLEWLKEYDGDRFYLSFADELYKIPLEANILVNDSFEDTKLQLNNYNDINMTLNALLLETKDLSFIPSSNPNIKGILEVYDYNMMDVTVQNIFIGVDKVGEITTTTIDKDKFKADVTQRFDKNSTKYNNYSHVKYYNLSDQRHTIQTLSLEDIADALGIKYTVNYNKTWDIYVIEVISE